jgi:hypothetical protein
LGVRQLVRRSRPKSRIPKKANGCCLRHKVVQQSQPLGLQQIGQDIDGVCRNPITGSAACCASAASGHAVAAPPSVARNFRRPMQLAM